MPKKERFTALITKYALTAGIQSVEAEQEEDTPETIQYDIRGFWVYAHGRDWHRTPESALARAEEMRQKRIATLKKELAKLEKMTFKAPGKPEYKG